MVDFSKEKVPNHYGITGVASKPSYNQRQTNHGLLYKD